MLTSLFVILDNVDCVGGYVTSWRCSDQCRLHAQSGQAAIGDVG